MKIDISPEMEDKIIIENLVRNIYYLSKASTDEYETPANKVRDLSAMLTVLRHYTTEGEFNALTKNLSIKMKPSKKEQ